MKKKMLIAFILVLVLIYSVQIAAQATTAQDEDPGSPLTDQTWVRLGGPPGGVGYDIRMNPVNPDIMYVTDSGAGIHKSTDRGRSWFTVNEGVDLRAGYSGDMIPVFCATIDPNNPDTVWIGLQNLGGIYRSDDNGETWQRKTRGIKESEGLTFRGISVQPGNSDVVFVAGEISSTLWAGKFIPGSGFGLVKGVIYKSTDRGESWREVWRGEDLARYVLINPENPEIIYASTGIFDREAANSDWTTNTPGGVGILKSIDGGETWTPMNEGLGNMNVSSLDFHPTDPDILIAGSKNLTFPNGGGAYITYDGAESWQHLVGTEISAVEFVDEDPNYVYAAGQHDFFRSRDGGQTWRQFSNARGFYGPDRMIVGIAMDFQVDPDDPNRIFLNTYQGGNFYSEDGGENWVPTSLGYSGLLVRDVEVSTANPALVVAAGRTGPFISFDGGLNWEAVLPQHDNTEGVEISFDPENSDHLLYGDGDQGCIRESFNSGLVWEQRRCHGTDLLNFISVVQNEFYTHQGPLALTFAPSNSQIVYAGFGQQHCFNSWDQIDCSAQSLKSILISRDGGNSWETILDEAIHGFTVAEVAVHPSDPMIAWAATSNGVKKTTDGGETWVDSSTGISAKIMSSVVVDPHDPERIFASANGGMFKSSDGGGNWIRSGYGIDSNEIVTSIVFDTVRPGVIYASTMRSGVYLSEDNGDSWQQINQGLTNRAIYKLSLSGDGNTLYAASQSSGVFRLSTMTQEEFDGLKPVRIASEDLEDKSGINIDGYPEDWTNQSNLYDDPAGDGEEGFLDLTSGYAFSTENSLYFLINAVDPDHPFVHFDIQFRVDDRVLQISWAPGNFSGFLGDITKDWEPVGETSYSEFRFGQSLEGRIDFRDFDVDKDVSMFSVNVMAGDGATWRSVDMWTPDVDTPFQEISKSTESQSIEIAEELSSDSNFQIIDGSADDWENQSVIFDDLPGDGEGDFLDLTTGYAYKTDDELYFLIDTVDAHLPFVQFDIQIQADDRELLISWAPGDHADFMGDVTSGYDEIGNTMESEFAFGHALEARVSLEDLGSPESVNLRQVNVMVGECCDYPEWRAADEWHPDVETPFRESGELSPPETKLSQGEVIGVGEIVIDGDNGDWVDRQALQDDESGDAEVGYLDLTAGYAFATENDLYFLVDSVDANQPFVHFDIEIQADSRLMQISWGPGDIEGFIADNTIGHTPIGPTVNSEFAFGPSLEGRISLADLGSPSKVDFRKVHVMVGECCDPPDWRSADDWGTWSSTPVED